MRSNDHFYVYRFHDQLAFHVSGQDENCPTIYLDQEIANKFLEACFAVVHDINSGIKFTDSQISTIEYNTGGSENAI